MNFVNLIAKIIRTPTKEVFNDNICINAFNMEFLLLLPLNSVDCLRVTFWEESVTYSTQNFQIGDYFLLEGYLTLRENQFVNDDELEPYFEFTVTNANKLVINDVNNIQ